MKEHLQLKYVLFSENDPSNEGNDLKSSEEPLAAFVRLTF